MCKHYDKTYPGIHQAIIDRKMWDDAQQLLEEKCQHTGRHSKRLVPLRGLVRCGVCGGVMKETFSMKTDQKNYRYFLCDKDSKRIKSTCPVKSIPAAELEKLVLNDIALMLSKPEMLAGVMQAAKEVSPAGANLQPEQIRKAFGDLVPVWDVMFPVERYKFIREVIRKVTVFPEEVKIQYNAENLAQVIREAEWGKAE